MKNLKTISIYSVVHEEKGEWIDWWIDSTDCKTLLPYNEKECAEYLRNFDVIIVGDKRFPGEESNEAITECYRQYKTQEEL